ncbi:hypothetical protein XENOCAPTIV_003193 [Xenoophorus captivus]|uniref:Uncharacterized protein n=1 Tax=Xenoophorus captivus TaxID=1517983 RepID=A0ABV0S1E6_9TELE
MNLHHPHPPILVMCTLTGFESRRTSWCVCRVFFFYKDLQVNLPSGCTVRVAHSAGVDKKSKKGKRRFVIQSHRTYFVHSLIIVLHVLYCIFFICTIKNALF